MDKGKEESKNKLKTIDNNVFKICISKCCHKDHTNFAGETIHHTVYECL
jgi:hypothetical protein